MSKLFNVLVMGSLSFIAVQGYAQMNHDCKDSMSENCMKTDKHMQSDNMKKDNMKSDTMKSDMMKKDSMNMDSNMKKMR
ncbi:hypothetical protein RYD26_03400 [Pasteurellaceae bacterium LIM206]|nr:hypothetical protein [Pasteurellaceae bacterium LIM206]